MAAAASSSGSGVQAPVPGAAGLIPLAAVKPNEPAPQPAPSTQSLNLPQPLRTEPMRPESHLEPLDAKPVMDFMAPEPPREQQKRDPAVETIGCVSARAFGRGYAVDASHWFLEERAARS